MLGWQAIRVFIYVFMYVFVAGVCVRVFLAGVCARVFIAGVCVFVAGDKLSEISMTHSSHRHTHTHTHQSDAFRLAATHSDYSTQTTRVLSTPSLYLLVSLSPSLSTTTQTHLR